MKLKNIQKGGTYSIGVVTELGTLDVAAAAQYFSQTVPSTMVHFSTHDA